MKFTNRELACFQPCSRDSFGHQHHTEKLSPKITLHLKCSVKVKQRYHSGYCSQICSYQIGKELCRTHHLVSMKTRIYKICNLYIGISQRCSLFLRNSKLLLAFILKFSLQIFYSTRYLVEKIHNSWHLPLYLIL